MFALVRGLAVWMVAVSAVAAPGLLDPTFGNGGVVLAPTTAGPAGALTAATQSDGKLILAGGCAATVLGNTGFCVARYLPSGALDTTFGSAGYARAELGNANADARTIAMQPDGRILVGGSCALGAGGCLLRYTTSGILDNTFGTNGVAMPTPVSNGNDVLDLKPLADGSIISTVTCDLYANVCLVRALSDGSPDLTFGVSGAIHTGVMPESSFHRARLHILADGAMLVAGRCPATSGNGYAFCVARFDAHGVRDNAFGNQGIASTQVVDGQPEVARSLVVDANGRIVLVGPCSPNVFPSFCTIRYLADGSLDQQFGVGGIVVTRVGQGWAYPTDVQLQPDGKLVVAGDCYFAGKFDFCFARLNAEGSTDTTWASAGSNVVSLSIDNDRLKAIVAQPDDRFVVAGVCDVNGISQFCAARLKGGLYNPLTCALNLDSNATVDSATDALLFTRYLLGYRGAALTTGAVGASPTRTNAEIETYLGALLQAGKLDVDGDGQSLPLTDGLLLVRAMLGLSGTALTNGATNVAHPNVRNAQQILTWIEATHGVACLP